MMLTEVMLMKLCYVNETMDIALLHDPMSVMVVRCYLQLQKKRHHSIFFLKQHLYMTFQCLLNSNTDTPHSA